MSIPTAVAKPFRGLRWKLTLNYTLVTVGAILVVELVVLILLTILLTTLLNSGFLQSQLIEAASVDYVPVLRFYLSQSPPDEQGIANWLERVGATYSVKIPISFDATNEMFVVGSDGRLLGVRPLDLFESVQVGQVFNPEIVPGLESLLKAGLSGEERLEELYTRAVPGEKVIIAIPVWDANHQEVLGVLVAMEPSPTLLSLLGEIIPILGISFLIFIVFAGLIGMVFGSLSARGLVRRLDRLSTAAQDWSEGDFTEYVADPAADELSQLAEHLNDMAQQLQILLAARRELAIVDERNRLARELHDSAKQQAFAAAAQISAAKVLLRTDVEAAQTHIEAAESLTHALRRELTDLIQELRPAALEDKGLVAALRQYAQDWSRQNKIELDFRVLRERSLPVDIEQSVFRISQEALANTARHSQATRAELSLEYSDTQLWGCLRDNGKGFDHKKIHTGFGLRSMQERLDLLGGSLTIQSSIGQGTQISWIVPSVNTLPRKIGQNDG